MEEETPKIPFGDLLNMAPSEVISEYRNNAVEILLHLHAHGHTPTGTLVNKVRMDLDRFNVLAGALVREEHVIRFTYMSMAMEFYALGPKWGDLMTQPKDKASLCKERS